MYMPFLMYGYAVALVLMLLGCRMALRSIPKLRGLRLLSWGMAFGLASVAGLALRPWAPAWLTILAANLSLFTAMLLMYCAVAETVAARMKFLPWGIALGAAGTAGFAWFTWVHAALMPRILLSSGICGVYDAAGAWILFRNANPTAEPGLAASTLQSLTSSMAWLEVAIAALHAVRCVLSVMFPPADFVHLDFIQGVFSYLNLLLVLGSVCGLVWLSLWRHRAELQVLAHTDGLTGLLTRGAFQEVLARELSRAARRCGSLAVLLLDVDHFKDVNDSLGHLAGDEVIRRVSEVLCHALRPADAVGRYGGEEFVCLLHELGLPQAEEVAERLRAEIAGLSELPGNVRVTASIGVALSHPADTADQLLRRCDDALYGSKRRGRNLVTSYRGFAGPADVSTQPA